MRWHIGGATTVLLNMKPTRPSYPLSEAQESLANGSIGNDIRQRTNLMPWLLGALGLVGAVVMLLLGTKTDTCTWVTRPMSFLSHNAVKSEPLASCGVAVPDGPTDHNMRRPDSNNVKPYKPSPSTGTARRAFV